jgi:starvation-inducible DNA-binding protein
MLIGHTEQLEQFHWFVRAHLETPGGQLKTTGTHTEAEAASRTRKK